MERLNKHQIIDETVAFYSADPVNRRAVENGRCVYLTADNRKCAFGRVMEDEFVTREMCNSSVAYLMEDMGYPSLLDSIVNEPLQEQYQGHEIKFWRSIQSLHDSAFWTEEGLTEAGREHVKYLKEKYPITEAGEVTN